MAITDELEELAEDQLCHECSTPLTDEEREHGYVCAHCIAAWLEANTSE